MAAADLLIKISANIDSAKRELEAVEKQLKGLGSDTQPKSTGEQLEKSFKKAQPLGAGLAATGAAVGAGWFAAVNGARAYEQQVSNTLAVMSPQDVAKHGNALARLGLDLGKSTSFGATDAQAGIEELMKAGVPAQAVLDGVGKAALDVAAATKTAVPDAAAIMGTAMNVFQKDASAAGHVADLLAGATNASNAEMGDLKYGLAAVGSVASGLGLSLDDTITGLALFSNWGLEGSDAGTSFKAMLNNLIPKTDKAAGVMQDLGLLTADGVNQFFDETGRLKSLPDIGALLNQALAGKTDMERTDLLQQMFGNDGQRVALALAQTGGDGIKQLAGEISKITVADAAATRLDNLNGSLEALGGSLETISIVLGSRLLPYLRQAAEFATNLANRFLELPESTQTLIAVGALVVGVVAAIAGGLILLGPVVIGLVGAFGAIGSILGVAGAAIAGLALPLALLAAAAGLLYLAWTNNWFGIQEATAAAWTWLQATFGQLVSWLSTNLPVAIQALAGFWQGTLLPALTAAGTFLQTYLVPALSAVAAWLGTNLPVAANLLAGAVGALAGFWTGTLLPAIQAVAGYFQSTLIPLWQAIGGVVFAVLGKEIQILAGLWQNVLGPALGAVGGKLDEVRGGINDILLPALQALGSFLGGVAGPILDAFKTKNIDPLIAAFNAITEAIKTVTTWLGNLGTAITTMELPWWLTPGSPTPFETGLWGVVDAMAAVDGANPFDRLPRSAFPGASTALPAAGPDPAAVVSRLAEERAALEAELARTRAALAATRAEIERYPEALRQSMVELFASVTP